MNCAFHSNHVKRNASLSLTGLIKKAGLWALPIVHPIYIILSEAKNLDPSQLRLSPNSH